MHGFSDHSCKFYVNMIFHVIDSIFHCSFEPIRIYFEDNDGQPARCIEIPAPEGERIRYIMWGARILTSNPDLPIDLHAFSTVPNEALSFVNAYVDTNEPINAAPNNATPFNAAPIDGIEDEREREQQEQVAPRRRLPNLRLDEELSATNAEELASYEDDLYPPPNDFDPTGKSLPLRTWLAVRCKQLVVQHGSKYSDSSISKIFNVTRSTFRRHYDAPGGPEAYNYLTIGQCSKFCTGRYARP